ncbi:MAG: PAS domain S-box protein [Gemmataceae bacterium]|nr:PAS domain S-box protein [Gemmataceae bacterium]
MTRTANSHDVSDLSQALFEEAGDALILFDPETDQVLDANPTAQLLTGFTRQELLRLQATYLFRFEGKGGMHRLRHAAHHTGTFHSQDGYFLRTAKENVWVPVNLTIARLHVQPKTLGLITARDMREQRAAHAQVKQMEAELRRVMGAVSDCLWSAEVDASGLWTFRFVAPVIEKITGRTPDFFRTGLESWRRVVHAEDRSRWEKALMQLRGGGSKTSQEEYRIVRPDGAIRWVRDSVIASAAEDQALRLDGVLTDITEARQAAEALRESQRALSTLLSNLPGMAYRCRNDRDWTMEFVSEGALELTGYAPADLVDNRSLTYAQLIHPDDQDLVWITVQDAVQMKQPFKLTYRIRKASGEEGWVWEQGQGIYGADGSLVALEGLVIDVTERKRADAALAHERDLLHTLMDNMPDLIYFKDTQLQFTRVNRAHATYLGLDDPQQAVGKSDRDFYAGEYADDFGADEQRILATGQPLVNKVERQAAGAEGKPRWILTTKVPFFDRDGNVNGLVGVSMDITEQKQVEEALRLAEAKYRSIFENASEGMYQSTLEGQFITVNPTLARILRFQSPEDLLAAVAVENRIFYADPGRREEFVRRMADQGAIENFESEIERRDGSFAWISENSRVLRDADGKEIGYEGTMIDITERKHAEAALARERSLLRSLIDSIPDLIFYKDRDGKYLGCNIAFERYAGRSKRDLIGKTDFELVSREMAEFYRERDRQVLASARAQRDEEWIEFRDGRHVLVETLQTPFVGANGQILGLIGMSRDITERKRLEEQLRQAQKMEAIGQLAGGVAHDFNNLLTAILGNVSLLLTTKPATDPEHELLSATEQAAQRATDLTRQLLGFSRQTMLRLEPTILNASVQEIVAILRRTIDPRIAVAIEMAADLGTVQADAGQMNQVLMNLCINARDAMPEGGRLLLRTENISLDETSQRQQLEARPGSFVRLRVQDTGQGIPADVLPRIFEPFFTTKGPGKGTGLGLAMVYGIVKQHQGWIECQSTVGKGTFFDIYLPRISNSVVRTGTRTAPVVTGRGSETIMLVDDEAVIRNVGRAILQRHGYHVVLAEDGQQALEIYQKEKDRISLVILDLTMPRLSGKDTLRQLLLINPLIPVILSSGYSADHIPEIGKEGVYGFVNKPYRPQDLTAAVRVALDRVKAAVRQQMDSREPGSRII